MGTVKIEEFYGDRTRYVKWKKAIEAQAELYRLEDAELAMLVYLSTKKDARDCLEQRAIGEYTKGGGLQLLWGLLNEAFGETEEELFERAEAEFMNYRRSWSVRGIVHRPDEALEGPVPQSRSRQLHVRPGMGAEPPEQVLAGKAREAGCFLQRWRPQH